MSLFNGPVPRPLRVREDGVATVRFYAGRLRSATASAYLLYWLRLLLIIYHRGRRR